MKTKAVRLHGANDLRLDEFELPEIKEEEMQLTALLGHLMQHIIPRWAFIHMRWV